MLHNLVPKGIIDFPSVLLINFHTVSLPDLMLQHKNKAKKN